MFYTKRCLTQKQCFTQTPYVFTQHITTCKNYVLAWHVQALSAACRIALSSMARETRRRRLNGYDFEPSNLPAWVAQKRTATAYKRFKDGAWWSIVQEKQRNKTSSTSSICQVYARPSGTSISRPAKRMDGDKWPARSRRKPSSDLQPGMRARMTKWLLILYKAKSQKTQTQLQANHAKIKNYCTVCSKCRYHPAISTCLHSLHWSYLS